MKRNYAALVEMVWIAEKIKKLKEAQEVIAKGSINISIELDGLTSRVDTYHEKLQVKGISIMTQLETIGLSIKDYEKQLLNAENKYCPKEQ